MQTEFKDLEEIRQSFLNTLQFALWMCWNPEAIPIVCSCRLVHKLRIIMITSLTLHPQHKAPLAAFMLGLAVIQKRSKSADNDAFAPKRRRNQTWRVRARMLRSCGNHQMGQLWSCITSQSCGVILLGCTLASSWTCAHQAWKPSGTRSMVSEGYDIGILFKSSTLLLIRYRKGQS